MAGWRGGRDGSGWLGAGLAAAVFGLLTLGERRRPLRRGLPLSRLLAMPFEEVP